jgi:hypothetical protein
MIINFVDIIQICHKKENTAKTSKQNCGEEYEIKHRTVTARAFQRGGGGGGGGGAKETIFPGSPVLRVPKICKIKKNNLERFLI